jgi:transposase InsO family protein
VDRERALVERAFNATRLNQWWASEFTRVATLCGFVHAGVVIDAFARRIVGSRVSVSLRADFLLDALEQAPHNRCGDGLTGLLRHSARGTQHLSMRYADRLVNAGIPSLWAAGGIPRTVLSPNR